MEWWYSRGSQGKGLPTNKHSHRPRLIPPKLQRHTYNLLQGYQHPAREAHSKGKTAVSRREYNQEQKARYNAQQAKKCERISKYSLDEENKRVYKARAEQWREKAESAYTYTITDNEKVQYYKPVTEGKEIETIIRKGKEIVLYKTSAVNDIYLSESVKVKRKAFHQFDMNIGKVYELLGATTSNNKPKICIIAPSEMASNAIASYNPAENRLNINAVLFYTDNLSELQKGFACPESEISTILHELIHWQEAEKYRGKFGEITSFDEYIEYLNKKFTPKLAKLEKEGYNISGISEYARKCYKQNLFDEVYTEYRVKQLLKG